MKGGSAQQWLFSCIVYINVNNVFTTRSFYFVPVCVFWILICLDNNRHVNLLWIFLIIQIALIIQSILWEDLHTLKFCKPLHCSSFFISLNIFCSHKGVIFFQSILRILIGSPISMLFESEFCGTSLQGLSKLWLYSSDQRCFPQRFTDFSHPVCTNERPLRIIHFFR